MGRSVVYSCRCSRSPASFLKADAGDPNSPSSWGWGERSRATGFKATFKAKPVS